MVHGSSIYDDDFYRKSLNIKGHNKDNVQKKYFVQQYFEIRIPK